jgi:T-complex protein 1 subunit eta
MFCAGRVPEEDLKRTMKACGGSVMSATHDINDSVLGSCDYFEERQVGGERYLLLFMLKYLQCSKRTDSIKN